MLKILNIVNKPKEIQIDLDFQEKYKQLTDTEIHEILQLRNSYQKNAAQAAIAEAIRRGIIQSEQDLFSEEYRQPNNRSSRFFPAIYKAEQKEKMLASIHRINFIVGIIPLIFSGLNYFKGEILPCIAYAGVGATWLYLSFRLSKTKSELIIKLMLTLLLAAFTYSIYAVSILKSLQIMDLAVTVIAFSVPGYCLMFARSILRNR